MSLFIFLNLNGKHIFSQMNVFSKYFVKIKLSIEESDSDRVLIISSVCVQSQLVFFLSLFKNVLHEKIILIKCYFDIVLYTKLKGDKRQIEMYLFLKSKLNVMIQILARILKSRIKIKELFCNQNFSKKELLELWHVVIQTVS